MNNIVPTLLLGKKEAQSSNSGHSGCQEHNRVQGEKGCQGRGQGLVWQDKRPGDRIGKSRELFAQK